MRTFCFRYSLTFCVFAKCETAVSWHLCAIWINSMRWCISILYMCTVNVIQCTVIYWFGSFPRLTLTSTHIHTHRTPWHRLDNYLSLLTYNNTALFIALMLTFFFTRFISIKLSLTVMSHCFWYIHTSCSTIEVQHMCVQCVFSGIYAVLCTLSFYLNNVCCCYCCWCCCVESIDSIKRNPQKEIRMRKL